MPDREQPVTDPQLPTRSLSRTERINLADRTCEARSRTFTDAVLDCDATDTQKAVILRAHRDYLEATRLYIRSVLLTGGTS
jgi:hypothetical protein